MNRQLAMKTQYASRLELLLHERLNKIDQLTAQVDQLRHRNKKLGLENEVLTAMIATPLVDAAMLAPIAHVSRSTSTYLSGAGADQVRASNQLQDCSISRGAKPCCN